MSLAFLNNIGLTDTESSLYELLLTLGEVPVPLLITKSKLKRPTVYKALQTLQKKELVTIRDIRKKLHVKPESPAKLQEIADKKAQQINEAKATLTALLPGMALSYAHSTEKPVVRIYEGVEGLKKIYLDTLDEGKPISAILQTSTIDPELFAWLEAVYVKKRKKAKIHAKVIVALGNADKEYVKRSPQDYRTVKSVNAKKFPFQHEIDIYGDKVAIINYKKDEPLIGMVIYHPTIATTMRAWFDLAWEHQAD